MSRSARKRGRRSGGGGGGHGMPALVPMIDMLVILVVYMLVHTADYEILPNTKNISIPQSVSESKPHESTVMMVTRDMIFVNGKPTVKAADIEADVAEAKEALQASLKEETQKLTLLKPYSMLKKIMMTATAADIGKMSLAVIEKEQAYRGPNPG
jgi:biopolymer transport protein TolR